MSGERKPRRARREWKDFIAAAPDANQALLDVGRAVDTSKLLDKQLVELVKLRCSQINGCAHCVQWHTNAARRLGTSEQRIQLLVTWRDAPSGLYSDDEEAALEWAEALTLVAGRPVEDDLYDRTLARFGEKTLAYLTTCVVSINAWNRISVAYRFTPPDYQP